MITVATRAEELDSNPVDCLAVQRQLANAALELMRRLPLKAARYADLLRLGASCVQIAAEQAFGARSERDAVRSWAECELGERQIRSATFQLLRAGLIRTVEYDRVFAVAAAAARSRCDEMHRLRRRLRLLAVI